MSWKFSKIFDTLLHLRDIHGLDEASVRYINRSGEESQLQAEPDQDSCHNSDSVMCAHNEPPVPNATDAVSAPVLGKRLTPDLFQGGFVGSSKWVHRTDTRTPFSLEINVGRARALGLVARSGLSCTSGNSATLLTSRRNIARAPGSHRAAGWRASYNDGIRPTRPDRSSLSPGSGRTVFAAPKQIRSRAAICCTAF